MSRADRYFNALRTLCSPVSTREQRIPAYLDLEIYYELDEAERYAVGRKAEKMGFHVAGTAERGRAARDEKKEAANG